MAQKRTKAVLKTKRLPEPTPHYGASSSVFIVTVFILRIKRILVVEYTFQYIILYNLQLARPNNVSTKRVTYIVKESACELLFIFVDVLTAICNFSFL